MLKHQHRNLKILLSIGGWTYSANFAPAASTPEKRATFAASAITLLKDCGFDGLDVDWEYPQNEGEAVDYVALLKVTREALDVYAASRNLAKGQFELTVACPAGPQNYERLKIKQMDKYLDFWNLMAYDYAGSWDRVAAHQANMFPDRKTPSTTPFSMQQAVEAYVRAGVSRQKMVLGCPLYGRAFVGVTGRGKPGDGYTGGVGEGSWENGVWDWKVLPKEGHKVHIDKECGASWSFDEGSRTLISFDNEELVRLKAEYVKEGGLGGVMWWESSGDRKVGQGSAIELVEGILKEKLEQKQNVIAYPESKYRNIRDGIAT